MFFAAPPPPQKKQAMTDRQKKKKPMDYKNYENLQSPPPPSRPSSSDSESLIAALRFSSTPPPPPLPGRHWSFCVLSREETGGGNGRGRLTYGDVENSRRAFRGNGRWGRCCGAAAELSMTQRRYWVCEPSSKMRYFVCRKFERGL